MARHGRRWAWVIVVGGLVLFPRASWSQALGPSGGRSTSAAGTTGVGMYANPYTNPYLNPFLNPYMTQVPVPGNPALYFLAAQQANGGIGSGRLSGVRPGSPAPRQEPVPDPSDSRRATDIPGAGAAHYFNRGFPPSASSARYYNRQGRYYPSRGR